MKRSVTFETYNEESIETCEPIDSGFVHQMEPISLRDLLSQIKYNGLQCIQETFNGLRVEHYPCDDYQTGETTVETMHVECSQRNAQRILKLIKKRL
jgi:hypothetical protein